MVISRCSCVKRMRVYYFIRKTMDMGYYFAWIIHQCIPSHDDDGCQVMRKAHLALWARWAKKRRSYRDQYAKKTKLLLVWTLYISQKMVWFVKLMIHKVANWSAHDLFCLNTARLSRGFMSIAFLCWFNITLSKIFPGTDSSILPL